MKAFGLHQYGGSEALQVIELPTPHPTAGQVHMQALAASINPVDEILCSSDLGAWYADTPPPTLTKSNPMWMQLVSSPRLFRLSATATPASSCALTRTRVCNGAYVANSSMSETVLPITKPSLGSASR